MYRIEIIAEDGNRCTHFDYTSKETMIKALSALKDLAQTLEEIDHDHFDKLNKMEVIIEELEAQDGV